MPANYSAGVFEQCLGDSGEVSPVRLSNALPTLIRISIQTLSQWACMAPQPFIRASRQRLPLIQFRPPRLAQPSAVSAMATISPEPTSEPLLQE